MKTLTFKETEPTLLKGKCIPSVKCLGLRALMTSSKYNKCSMKVSLYSNSLSFLIRMDKSGRSPSRTWSLRIYSQLTLILAERAKRLTRVLNSLSQTWKERSSRPLMEKKKSTKKRKRSQLKSQTRGTRQMTQRGKLSLLRLGPGWRTILTAVMREKVKREKR